MELVDGEVSLFLDSGVDSGRVSHEFFDSRIQITIGGDGIALSQPPSVVSAYQAINGNNIMII